MEFPLFIRPSRDGPHYVLGYGGRRAAGGGRRAAGGRRATGGGRRAAGGRPHRFPHDSFSSVYWIFTKLDHMISQWKGKNPIYFGVIR